MTKHFKSHIFSITKHISAFTIMCLLLFIAYTPVSATPGLREVHPERDSSHCHSQVFDLITRKDIPSSAPIGQAGSLSGKQATSKRIPRKRARQTTPEYIPLVAIVIEFDGLLYHEDYDWHSTFFSGNQSVACYYKDMSFEKFTFTPVQEISAFEKDGNKNTADAVDDGIIHITLEQPKNYAWDMGDGYKEKESDIEMMTAFTDALVKAGEYMSFSDYDTNKDGQIQNQELAVCFVVAGNDAAYEGSSLSTRPKLIWPFAWSFSKAQTESSDYPSAPSIDGIVVDSYIAMAENCRNNDGSYVQDGIGVAAHELGHYLGLPDLYSTGGHSNHDWYAYKVNELSLMDYGMYGTTLDGEDIPFSLDIWSRTMLGWVEPDMASAGTFPVSDALKSSADGNSIALRIETGRENEYYLLENRRFTGWDEGMSTIYKAAAVSSGNDMGGGIILWHIDDEIYETYNYANQVNDYDHHPAVIPLYLEKTTEGQFDLIGTRPNTRQAFFSADNWPGDLQLPLYGTNENDKPADRTQSEELELRILTSPADEIQLVHFHGKWSETITRAATCVKEGEKTLTCAGCDRSRTVTIPIDAKAHSWGDWKVQTEPTESAEGLEVRICSNDPSHKETRVIPKLTPKEDSGALGRPVITTRGKSPDKMTIRWTKVKGASWYRLAYRRIGASSWKKVVVKDTKKTIRGMKSGALYQFKVQAAKKGTGVVYGKYSKTSCRFYRFIHSPKYKSGKKSIRVSWKKAPGANGYMVLYSTNKNLKGVAVRKLAGNKKQSCTIRGLKSGKTYYVAILAYKKKGSQIYKGVHTTVRAVKVR